MGSGRRNRLAPTGELLATGDRGTMWGNRGQLLDADGRLVRHHSTVGWVICRLRWRGRRRSQWQPGRLTELFLLDEATGLAAGHRPCGLCRHADLAAFKAAWAVAHPDADTSAPGIDAVLHAQRLAPRVAGADPVAPRPRPHDAPAQTLPDATLVALDGGAWLVRGTTLRRWTAGGYAEARRRPRGPVAVLTPAATVATLGEGYCAQLHPSA